MVWILLLFCGWTLDVRLRGLLVLIKHIFVVARISIIEVTIVIVLDCNMIQTQLETSTP